MARLRRERLDRITLGRVHSNQTMATLVILSSKGESITNSSQPSQFASQSALTHPENQNQPETLESYRGVKVKRERVSWSKPSRVFTIYIYHLSILLLNRCRSMKLLLTSTYP